MSLTIVSGDPLLTKQPVLGIGVNAAGRGETTPLATTLHIRYPAAFAGFSKLCKQGKIKPGMTWFWRETQPALAFMVVRETPFGATRLRHVEAVVLTLARDYKLDNLKSIALAPLGAPHEIDTIREVLDRWLVKSSLPVIAYTDYRPGISAEPDPTVK